MAGFISKSRKWAVLIAALLIGGLLGATQIAPALVDDQDIVTGELKIIKNLGGDWPSGAFIFTWDCTDGQSGQATFPDDFTGANFDTGQEYEIGTTCTVEETDGVLSVSDFFVSTQIENGPGFQPINPRDIDINNSQGTNTIKFMNDPRPDCEDPYQDKLCVPTLTP